MELIKRYWYNTNLDKVIILTIFFFIFSYLSSRNFFLPVINDLNEKFFVSFLLFIFFLFMHKIVSPEKSISTVIRDIITGKTQRIYGILGLLFILSMVSWLGDSIYNFDNKEYSFIHIPTIFINIFSMGLVYIIFYPNRVIKGENNKGPEERKVLIMALSKWYNYSEENFEKLKKDIDNGKLNNEKLNSNWELPIRAILYHLNKLEKVIFLVSQDSGEENHWKKFIEILRYISKTTPGAEKIDYLITSNCIKKSDKLDFDDHEEIMDFLKKEIKSLKREGFVDEDITVNISCGTSAITLCLTLFALEDNRQIEYFTQRTEGTKPSELKRFDLNKDDAIVFLESLSL